jgi:hypothetical protein
MTGEWVFYIKIYLVAASLSAGVLGIVVAIVKTGILDR